MNILKFLRSPFWRKSANGCFYQTLFWHYQSKAICLFSRFFIKKTDESYIEWQRVVHRVTTNENKWQRVVHRMTTSDNKWQRVTTSDSEWYNEWQRVATNGNQWQRVRAVVQRMKTAEYTSKNGWLPSFHWQKEIHYNFKWWMAAVWVAKQIDFP